MASGSVTDAHRIEQRLLVSFSLPLAKSFRAIVRFARHINPRRETGRCDAWRLWITDAVYVTPCRQEFIRFDEADKCRITPQAPFRLQRTHVNLNSSKISEDCC